MSTTIHSLINQTLVGVALSILGALPDGLSISGPFVSEIVRIFKRPVRIQK